MSKNYYPPVRPPRGTKVSKDTSGRLMTIIAELSVSSSNEDRKRKMQQLKKDFESSDACLVKLISAHRDQLSITMESFSKISAKINTSRRGCRDVKEKLLACKKLLECKRDEIRRLWCESVEHHEVISMLKEINDLNKVHGKVEDSLKQGNFTKATELVVSSIDLFKGKLSAVDALKDLKSEVYTLRETLHGVLVQELHKYLYMSPESVFLNSKKDCSEGKIETYEDIFSKKYRKTQAKLPVVGSCYDFNKDPNYERISVVLNCITALNTLPETVEILKDGMQRELMAIVKNSSQLMFDTLQNSSFPCASQHFSPRSFAENSEESHFLLDLLEVILEQFRYVAINHQSFLDNLERIMMTNNLTDISYYELADVLSKIQATVEIFVSDYLDLHNTATTQRSATTFAKVPTVSDISSFFLRKNVTRPKKHALFKFDGSSHAINMKTYLQEQKDSLKGKKDIDSVEADPVLVCQPTTKNIIIIFKALKKFISEIEFALKSETGSHCPLHTFLMDSVKIFLDQINIEVNRLLENTTHSLETWKPVSDMDDLKAIEAKTGILNSTYTLNCSLKDMEKLIYALPEFSDYFIRLICNILQTYKDLCNSAYKGLIYPDFSEEQRVFSLSWARDKDISRLLRSLPNWTNLKVQDNCENTHEFEESPEEIRFRNKEESELLIRNLSCGKDSISPCEIITDHIKLLNLAMMHESMEWLSNSILVFAESLPDIQASVSSSLHEKFNDETEGNLEITVGTSNKQCLKKLAKDFEDLADTCLLVLHLEVRAHSFYYLLPLSKQGSYMNRKDDQEPEPEVVRLNTDLSKIDEVLAPVLQPKKIKYIFEGLGELLSTVLINSVSNIKKINENGVKKMGRNIFAIQQNLAGITMTREVALDRARQYFDLLNHTFEDILNNIVEEGPQFQEHEYSAVIQLLHNSREGIYEQEPVNIYLEKLRQILDEVAVSV